MKPFEIFDKTTNQPIDAQALEQFCQDHPDLTHQAWISYEGDPDARNLLLISETILLDPNGDGRGTDSEFYLHIPPSWALAGLK